MRFNYRRGALLLAAFTLAAGSWFVLIQATARLLRHHP